MKKWLALLPTDMQERLAALRVQSLTMLGTPMDLQRIVVRHADLFEKLVAGGLTHRQIGEILMEVGIARADGLAFGQSTISSALHRMRERQPPANSCSTTHSAADHRTALPFNARSGNGLHAHASSSGSPKPETREGGIAPGARIRARASPGAVSVLDSALDPAVAHRICAEF
jgi:hypothetical protein